VNDPVIAVALLQQLSGLGLSLKDKVAFLRELVMELIESGTIASRELSMVSKNNAHI